MTTREDILELKRRIRQRLRRLRSPEDLTERFTFRSVQRAFRDMIEIVSLATAHHWSPSEWRRIRSQFRDVLYEKFEESYLEDHLEEREVEGSQFKSYYDYSGETLQEIASKWAEERAMMRDVRDAHAWFPLSEVWPHREYTWTREDARPGPLRIDGEFRDYSGPEKWDVLEEKLKEEGWREDRPAIIQVSPSGDMKVGEGNHRLAIARQLGIREVPVRFHFREG